jgi:hypothetical protein
VVDEDRGTEEVGEHRSEVVVNDRVKRRAVCTDRMARREIGRIISEVRAGAQLTRSIRV